MQQLSIVAEKDLKQITTVMPAFGFFLFSCNPINKRTLFSYGQIKN